MLAAKVSLVYFSDEEDWEGQVASGALKHWHILNIKVSRIGTIRASRVRM